MSFVDIASKDGRFTTLLKLAEIAGLAEFLAAPGHLTLFAPTDDAFAQLDKWTVDYLLQPRNKEALQTVLKYHVLNGRVMSHDIVGTATPFTLAEKNLCVYFAGEGRRHIQVNDARVTEADILADNGVIHVIDKVLNPLESCADCLGSCSYAQEVYQVRHPAHSARRGYYQTPRQTLRSPTRGHQPSHGSSYYSSDYGSGGWGW